VEQLILGERSTRPAALANKQRDLWFELRSTLIISHGINKPMKPWKRNHLSTCSPSLPSSAGITLVEVVIVTLLLGIIAMLGMPTLISALEDARLNGATTETVTALEFAHSKAVNSGREIRVAFDVAADTIDVAQFTYTADLLGGAATLPETDVENVNFVTMYHPLKPGDDYRINLASQPLFGGVNITAVDFGGNNYVTFDALGQPSNGGTTTLGFGSRQMVVTLDALTGKVTVSK
jgi:type II secretory pathway pseudopilin PulG